MNNKNILSMNLKDWVSFETALFEIGRALGIFASEYADTPNIRLLLRTQNSVNDALVSMAEELVRIGYLEYDERGMRYRLNPGFDVTKFDDSEA